MSKRLEGASAHAQATPRKHHGEHCEKGAMGGGAAGATGDGRGVMRALRQYTEVGEVNWVSV